MPPTPQDFITRFKAVATTTYRALDLVGFDPGLLVVGSPPVGQPGAPRLGTFGPPIIEFMELPPVTGTEPELWAPRVAAYANPWCAHQKRTRLQAQVPCYAGKYRENCGKAGSVGSLR